ncbi:hypothetical protein NDU88_002698 [Pleurodeles waltl]|uniref:Uncharacterized protein n=1 Tax=Pleurodeles waltl TaxID=8319 RepID=A0AAV7NG60_PLEWA|nr:hypothetical protein NDU88_002698 [Pleurodeles waltl]
MRLTLGAERTSRQREASWRQRVRSEYQETPGKMLVRSGAREGYNEGDPIVPLDDPAPQALVTLPSPILEHDSAPRPTRTEHKRKQGQEQEHDSISCATSFGTGSSIIEELVVLADTALEECWNSPNSVNNDKDNNKNALCGGAKRSNLYPVSYEYELEASGPASTRGSVNTELGKRKTEPPSGNNWVIVAEIRLQSQPQTEVVEANEPTDNGLQDLLKASQEWPTIIEQDDWPLREKNMGAPSTGKGTKSPQEENPPQNAPHKERGDVVRSDYIIETISASLLAAVKALTWQSNRMENHLELTHVLAQSILTLDSKLNSLCGKLDNWDYSGREDKVAVGSRNDEMIDKLATRPDLVTSIIQHCKIAI